jgi:glycosyltransferase involved in cell wall biosynthesis
MKTKVIRTSTVAISLNYLLKGQLAFLNEHYEVIAVSGKDDDLEIVAEREKIKVIPVKMERSISLIKDVKSLLQLYFLFKNEKPNIVHSITPKAGLLSMLAAKFACVPVRVHTFTGLVFPSKKGFFQKLLIFMDKVLCKCATHVYPEGEGVKNDLIRFNITEKPLKVIANGNINGIDVEYFNPKHLAIEEQQNLKNNLGISESDFVYIFVGRLVNDKGINELVKAFSKLSKEILNIKLLLVGSFEEDLDPLEKETFHEIKNNKNIISVGFQKNVRSYYAISNVLVFPSYREGFPNVVLQAGAMGLPSVVTNINGSNEIISDLKNGLVIPVKDTLALINAMKNIINVKIYSKLKNNSREMIVNRYDQQLVWQATLDEYEKILI